MSDFRDFVARRARQEPDGESPGASNFRHYMQQRRGQPTEEFEPEPVAAPLRPGEGTAWAGEPMQDNTSNWGSAAYHLNNAMLGAPEALASRLMALYEGGLSEYGELQPQIANALSQGRRDFAEENPREAVISDIAAPLPATIGALMMGQTYAAIPLAANLARLGKGGEIAGNLLTGGARGGANLLERVGTKASWGGVEGAAAGALTSGLHEDPLGEQVASGAGIGAIATPLAETLTGRLRSAVGPFQAKIAPHLAKMLDKLEQRGVSLPPGHMLVDDPKVRKLGERIVKVDENELLETYTKDVARHLGMKSDTITPGQIDAHKRELGQMFDDVYKKSYIDVDPDFITDLQGIRRAAQRQFHPDSDSMRSVDHVLGQVRDFARQGRISGEQLEELLKYRSGVIGALKKKSDTGDLGRDLHNAIDRALYRSLNAGPFPRTALLDDLAKAKRQWRDTIAVEKAADKSGSGIINPRALLGAAQKTGTEELKELGHLGQLLPRATPHGGAAEATGLGSHVDRLWQETQHLGKTGKVAAATAGAAYMIPELAGVAGTHALPGAVGLGVGAYIASKANEASMRRLMGSPWYRNKLMSDAVQGYPASPVPAEMHMRNLLSGSGRLATPAAVNMSNLPGGPQERQPLEVTIGRPAHWDE
jgi:hypothetical protein